MHRDEYSLPRFPKEAIILVLLISQLACLSRVTVVNVRAQVDEVQILSHSGSTTPQGWYRVVGELKNFGDRFLSVTVNFNYYDANGSLIVSKNSSTALTVISPNRTAPFGNYLTNPEASRVRSYDISIISYVETNQAKPYSLSIEPQKVRYDNTTIYGIIENNGYVAANKTMVYATFYDKDGGVVDLSSTDPGTVEDIPKAQNTWFMIGHYVLSNIFERAKWFSLTAECLQYSLEKETGLLRFLPPPFVVFSVDPGTNVTTGQTTTFNATGSHASENRTVISYKWDFGDNTTGEGMITTHFYEAAGNYTVELTVKDSEGLDALALQIMTVYEPAAGEIDPAIIFYIFAALVIISAAGLFMAVAIARKKQKNKRRHAKRT